MIALSKKIELDCQLYIKTRTESSKRTIDINAVAHCVNHNISKTDFFIFLYVDFLSRTLTNHRTAGEGEGFH